MLYTLWKSDKGGNRGIEGLKWTLKDEGVQARERRLPGARGDWGKTAEYTILWES